MLNAGADMLEYLGLNKHCNILRNAIDKTINVDQIHTPDLGGNASTQEVVGNILKEIKLNTTL